MEAKSNGSFCPWVILGKVVPKPGLAGKFMPHPCADHVWLIKS